ncbi:hypothetical protein BKA70DRAFT_230605 [Coprinopsis sp. MPI-PUGE-AT-0042]|nr:hypothetical protein BKA70DRAFT_230605 [Coprinopsis sp. MPI-PUGE-AT-0042]
MPTRPYTSDVVVSQHFGLLPNEIKSFKEVLKELLKKKMSFDKSPGGQEEKMREIRNELAKKWSHRVDLADEKSARILAEYARRHFYRVKKREVPMDSSDDDDTPTLNHRFPTSRVRATRGAARRASRNLTPSVQAPSHKAKGSRGPKLLPVVKTEQITNDDALMGHGKSFEASREQGEKAVKEVLLQVAPRLPLWLFDKVMKSGLNSVARLHDLSANKEKAIAFLDEIDERARREKREELSPYDRTDLLDAFRKIPIDLS